MSRNSAVRNLLLFLVFAGLGFAQLVSDTPSVSQCPSSSSLEKDADDCEEEGMGWEYYTDKNGCKQVECVEKADADRTISMCPSEEQLYNGAAECERNGKGWQYYTDDKGCKQVRCITRNVPAASCPSVDEEVKKCEALGDQYKVRWGVVWYDNVQCPTVTCEPVSCLSQEELEEKIEQCRSSGLDYIFKGELVGLEPEWNAAGGRCIQVECVVPRCPGEEELDEAAGKCEAAGFRYHQWEWRDSASSRYAVEKENQSADIGSFFDVFTADDYFMKQCQYVVCDQPLICKSDEEVLAEIERCKLSGQDYEIFRDDNDCVVVKCGGSLCPTSDEIETERKRCMNQEDNAGITWQTTWGQFPNSYDSFFDVWGELDLERTAGIGGSHQLEFEPELLIDRYGCERVLCRPVNACPDSAALEATLERCKNAGLNATTYTDQFSCKQVYCGEGPRPVDCRKAIDDNGCTVIECSDGYVFNSCRYDVQCRVDCRTYTDDNGCFVKKCSDGYEARECPGGEVTCEVTRDDEGCEVKKCTDGSASRYCPGTEECRIYMDEKSGCTIKECPDGYKARECPDEPRGEIECKVYEKGDCRIKECTNGYFYDSCDENVAFCSTDKDDEGCTVKKCDDGYVARDCPEGMEDVECKETRDERGCVYKVCTDRTEASYCPEDVAPQRGILESLWCGIFGCK